MGSGCVPESDQLRDYVARIWFYEGGGEQGFEQIGATVHAQLLINLDRAELCLHDKLGRVECIGGVALQGMLTRPMLIDRNHKRRICGVQFTVAGMTRFVDAPATALADRLVGAASVWDQSERLRETLIGSETDEQRQALVERFLLERLRPEPASWKSAQRAATMLIDGSRVGDVQAALGFSQRALHLCFDAHVGVRPKIFARVARAHRAREAQLGGVIGAIMPLRSASPTRLT